MASQAPFSSFRFKRLRPATRHEWSLIASSKPSQIVEQNNVPAALRFLEDIAFVDYRKINESFDEEEGEIIDNPELKACHIAQLSTQYLTFTIERMRLRNELLKKELRKQEERSTQLDTLSDTQLEKIKQLSRQNDDLQRIVESHHRVLQTLNPELARKLKLKTKHRK